MPCNCCRMVGRMPNHSRPECQSRRFEDAAFCAFGAANRAWESAMRRTEGGAPRVHREALVRSVSAVDLFDDVVYEADLGRNMRGYMIPAAAALRAAFEVNGVETVASDS